LGPSRLFVGSLNLNLNEEDLRQIFSPFGEIDFVSLQRDPANNQSQGIFFLFFFFLFS